MITGQSITDLRHLAQATQEDLAKAIGVDVRTVQRWESCPGASVKGPAGHLLWGIYNDLTRSQSPSLDWNLARWFPSLEVKKS